MSEARFAIVDVSTGEEGLRDATLEIAVEEYGCDAEELKGMTRGSTLPMEYEDGFAIVVCMVPWEEPMAS